MNPRKANDAALEWLIFTARIASGAYLAMASAFLVGAALTTTPVLAYAAGVLLLAAGFTGWFGWWQFGNPEWRRGYRPGLCPARRGEYQCNIQVDPDTGRHPALHWDSIRDPQGVSKWT
jgi:hypothetical protein